jgi:hypothetical protein
MCTCARACVQVRGLRREANEQTLSIEDAIAGDYTHAVLVRAWRLTHSLTHSLPDSLAAFLPDCAMLWVGHPAETRTAWHMRLIAMHACCGVVCSVSTHGSNHCPMSGPPSLNSCSSTTCFN